MPWTNLDPAWITHLVSATATVTFAVERDGYVLDLPHWAELTGQNAAEMKGEGWMTVLHPDDTERVRAAWRTAVSHEAHYNTDYRLRCADGIYRWFNARAVPILDKQGAVQKWIGIILAIPGSNRFGGETRALPAGSAKEYDDITPAALRASRAMLGWSAETLARNAKVSLSTVRRLEGGPANDVDRRASITKILATLAEQRLTFAGRNRVIHGVIHSDDAGA